MKLSVSLPEEDLAFIDEYVARHRSQSRSAVIHDALNLLREAHLEEAYTVAFEEWDSSEDALLWDSVAGDGLSDAER
ncbi:hypothetical protein GCM10009555_050380 [Acrocarpospora macrocephala]|uniref:Ribbon-helix-helix protein CopG domain-containing protein n=1 Tax=Acrocarpospora macrocephala TaxID=150177 RepID=A0A5M3X7N5_9ACTN|nr:ribbon-helix-helix domain-containing protein [Acrocarpospora macrocephala]GES16189.1 hypothetical protein Amac_097870 [Acrocarpospora macrocephala]